MSAGFKATLGYLAAFAVFEALALYVMENYERVRMPEWVGYSGEASRNNYLAAQRFVVAMGREARGVDTLYGEPTMPPKEATIIVSGDRRLMSPVQSRRLLEWVKAGGDLLVTVGDDVSKDPVLQAIGVRLSELDRYSNYYLPNDYMVEPENWVTYDPDVDSGEGIVVAPPALPEANDDEAYDEDEEDEEEDGEEDAAEEGVEDAEADVPPSPEVPKREADEEPRVRLHIPGSSETFDVYPPSHELISTEQGWQVAGRNASYAVREPYGEGQITVVGSLWSIENQSIGELDNAPFFWALLVSGGHTGPVWFVFGDDIPSIWSAIVKKGWPALAALGLLVVLLLWRHMPRVGSPIAPLAPIRRELIEHVDATGRFLVDHSGAHILVASVQKHVKRRLLMRYPQVAALPERERRGRLAQLAKLSQAEVDAIYRPQVGLSRNDFVAVQRVLERLSQNP